MDFPHKGQRKRGETKEEVKKTVMGGSSGTNIYQAVS